jgi:hypothetical protein
MKLSLQDWVQSGWASQHNSSRQEISKLLALSDRDLANCATSGLDADWRFAIAYNAALQSATAALAAAGFRASREAHHLRVIHSLAFTIGTDKDFIRRFDAFRKKRNLRSYEMEGTVSDQEADEMAVFAADLRSRVEHWIRENHSELQDSSNDDGTARD